MSDRVFWTGLAAHTLTTSKLAERKMRPRMLKHIRDAMSKRKTITSWAVVVLAIVVAASMAALLHRRQPVTLHGAVLRQDQDPNRQLPLADVEIVATNALGSGTAKSDSSGLFTLTLPKGLRRRQEVL